MKVSLSKLKSISPYKLLLDSGDIIYAKVINSNIRTKVLDNGNIIEEVLYNYDIFLNDKKIGKQELKQFLLDKNIIIQLDPNKKYCCEFCGKILFQFNGQKDIKINKCNCAMSQADYF